MSFQGRILQRAWHLVDAKDQTVGRLAAQIAPILKGKHKPTYRPNGDCGDVVVIVNAEKVHFSGKKWKDKLYRWHTGYPGGLKQRRAEEILIKKPGDILRKAILGMLKRTRLRESYIKNHLKIYVGPNHPHEAQLPAGVETLPKHPRANMKDFRFGFGQHYSSPGSYQIPFSPVNKT